MALLCVSTMVLLAQLVGGGVNLLQLLQMALALDLGIPSPEFIIVGPAFAPLNPEFAPPYPELAPADPEFAPQSGVSHCCSHPPFHAPRDRMA